MDVSSIAAAIGDPARARMLFCLMDNRARTSTELGAVAEVSASTASAHLARLKAERLVKVLAQGKHRYYSLESREVAAAIESLSVLAGGRKSLFQPNTPVPLRQARTCYDHIAGALGVALHDRLMAMDWLDRSHDVTQKGTRALERLGVDVDAARGERRRFAFGCLDWSERRHHLGGAMGAAILNLALRKNWVERELDSRALAVTGKGRREMRAAFGLEI